jgi:RNA recognition motif-containing protein
LPEQKEKGQKMQTKLYVGNLDRSVTNEDLKTLFSNHGEVRESKLIEGKGFGFVEMSNQAEAESAKKVLNGSDFKGRKLKVDIAQPPRNRLRGQRYR